MVHVLVGQHRQEAGSRYPLVDQHRVAPGKFARYPLEKGEGNPLQALVVQHKAPVLPVQQLDVGASAVQKEEHLPAGGAPSHARGNQAAEPVEGFAHVAVPVVEMIPMGRAEGEHGLWTARPGWGPGRPPPPRG